MMMSKKQRLIGIVIIATILLLIPFISMFFTTEVNWDATDFLVAAIILFGTGFLTELILRKIKNTSYRIIIAIIFLILIILFWLELAVGVFGSPIAGT